MRNPLLASSLVALVACGGPVPQTLSLEATGLYLSDNPLSAPPGSLSDAKNAVIRFGGIVEPMRGYDVLPGTLPGGEDSRAMQLMTFGPHLLGHDSSTVFRHDASAIPSEYVAYGGTYIAPSSPVVDQNGDEVPARMRYSEAGGAFYFTSNAGLYRLDDVTDTAPVAAGVPPAYEGEVSLAGTTGFLANNTSVAYRVLWGTRDGDGALLLGAPSGRMTITNASGGSRDVTLTVRIPEGVTTSHFLQVYRTTATASTIDPGDDMAQVLEQVVMDSDAASGFITVTDIASAPNGPPAYFNNNGGDGIGGSKREPPVLSDVVAFKGYQFGVVQQDRTSLQMALMAVGGSGGIANGQGIRILRPDGDLDIFLGASFEETNPDASPGTFQVFTSGTAAQNIENTARSLIRVINRASWSSVFATYASGPTDFPGQIILSSRSLTDPPFTLQIYGPQSAWTPATTTVFAAGLMRSSNQVTAMSPLSIPHGFVTGQVVHIEATAGFASGNVTITGTPSATSFTYAEVGPNLMDGSATATSTVAPLSSEDGVTPNTWAHSAYEEPDAWPPAFRFTVGGPQASLLRITQQADSLLFWTTDGLYRLTGTDEFDFVLRPVDSTLLLVGEDTPASVGNRVYALTNRGVVAVSESTVELVSNLPTSSVQKALLPIINSTGTYRDAVNHASFGLSYESEHEYWLWTPTVGDTEGATSVFIFNTQTRAWTRAILSAYCAAVPPGTSMRVGPRDYGEIWMERRDYSLTDYQMPSGAGVDFAVTYNVNTAKNPGSYKQWTETTVLMAKPQPATIGMTFATEMSETPEGGTIPTQGNAAARTYIPLEKSRSARLAVGIQHSTPNEKIQVLGLSVVHSGGSTKVGR